MLLPGSVPGVQSRPGRHSVQALHIIVAEREIEARGLEIFALMSRANRGVAKNITDRLMNWSIRNEALKVQLFRQGPQAQHYPAPHTVDPRPLAIPRVWLGH